MSSDITVVLNGFKRPHRLAHQLEAIKNQTIKPTSIMMWQNQGSEFDKNLTNQTIHASSNCNFGVWARFAYALNAKTEYVCVFDDDTIPGNRWFENCLNTMAKTPGLLGTVGIVLGSPEYPFSGFHRVGWPSANQDTVEADIVGHSWFFKRDWLSYFWRELPAANDSMLTGEDVHFTAMLQRHGNIKTFVPPHPTTDMSLWGSIPKLANEYGIDNVAISCTGGHAGMNVALKKEISLGFKPTYMRK